MSSIDMPGLGWILVFAIGVLCVSILGIYAASSEKVLVLKIFAGLMGIGMIIMMIFGIIAAVERNQLKAAFTSPTSEEVGAYMKKQEFTSSLKELQPTVMFFLLLTSMSVPILLPLVDFGEAYKM